MSMSLFPSPEERIVASALLLLSNIIPRLHRSTSKSESKVKQKMIIKSKEEGEEEEERLSSFKSHSASSSTLTSDGSSLNKTKNLLRSLNNKLRFNVATVSRRNEMKFKVVRKKRSKVISCTSTYNDNRKIVLSLPATASFHKPESSIEEAVSCISSTSTAASSSRSRYNQTAKQPKRRRISGLGSGSAKMSRKADAILKMLSSRGSSSEVKIRQALGDSPDTSKALRMLLKQEEVKRSGTGGRLDPYIYKIA